MMKHKSAFSFLLAAIFLSACNSGQPKQQQQRSQQLIEVAEQYDIDTLEAQPIDTVYSAEVGSVLRHYPELYHAARRVRKAYDGWVEQTRQAGLSDQTALMDISHILDESLLESADDGQAAWPDLSSADSLYLQLLANEPDTKRKSDIGRARRAWLNYIEQLKRLSQAMPENSRQRYATVIERQARAYQDGLK